MHRQPESSIAGSADASAGGRRASNAAFAKPATSGLKRKRQGDAASQTVQGQPRKAELAVMGGATSRKVHGQLQKAESTRAGSTSGREKAPEKRVRVPNWWKGDPEDYEEHYRKKKKAKNKEEAERTGVPLPRKSKARFQGSQEWQPESGWNYERPHARDQRHPVPTQQRQRDPAQHYEPHRQETYPVKAYGSHEAARSSDYGYAPERHSRDPYTGGYVPGGYYEGSYRREEYQPETSRQSYQQRQRQPDRFTEAMAQCERQYEQPRRGPTVPPPSPGRVPEGFYVRWSEQLQHWLLEKQPWEPAARRQESLAAAGDVY